MSFKAALILASILSVLIIVFQNSQPVSIRVLFWQVSMSGILLFPLIFSAGILAGWLFCLFFKRKDR